MLGLMFPAQMKMQSTNWTSLQDKNHISTMHIINDHLSKPKLIFFLVHVSVILSYAQTDHYILFFRSVYVSSYLE